MRSWKLLGAVFVTVILCAGLLNILPEGDAGNVGATTLTDVADSPSVTFENIEWHPAADYAVAIGEAGLIYEVNDPMAAGDWNDISFGNDDWWGIDYDSNADKFVICGQDPDGTANVQTYDNVGGFTAIGGPVPNTEVLRAVAVGSQSGEFIVVGNDTGTGTATIKYWDGGAYNDVTATGIPVAGDVIQDVCYSPSNERFFMVGNNSAGDGIVYYVNETNLTNLEFNELQAGASAVGYPLTAIEWNPDGAEGYGIVVGNNSTVKKLYNSTATLDTISSSLFSGATGGNPYINFTDVAFNPGYAGANEEALIVGNDGSTDRIIRFQDYGSTEIVSNVTGQSAFQPMSAVAFKPKSSPGYATMVGSNDEFLLYNTVESSRSMTVTTVYPHISEITMTHVPSGGSMLNNKLDVDPGTSAETYNITIHAYHDEGWGNVGSIDLFMWHDGGVDGTGGSTYDAGANNNTRSHFNYTFLGIDVYDAPNGWGENETELLSVTDYRWNDTYHNVTFIVRFNKQVWATDGAFSEATAGDQGTQTGKITGLDDQGTWDMEVIIWDTIHQGSDTKWDEFGVYQYTELTTAGLPGEQSGSGPPGYLLDLGPDEDVNYSANCDYRLKVWVTDLWNPAFDDVIPATALNVTGGNLNVDAVYFAGEGVTNSQYLLGDAGTYITSNTYGNFTLTSDTKESIHGAEENDATNLPVDWWCNIPAGVSEDYFYGTATYVLEHA